MARARPEDEGIIEMRAGKKPGMSMSGKPFAKPVLFVFLMRKPCSDAVFLQQA